MNKMYRQYRLGVCIGLLTLGTLSSCANTQKRLAIDNVSQQEEYVDNAASSQTTNRFSRARTMVESIVAPWRRIGQDQLLWMLEWTVIGYGVGYAIGYSIGSTTNDYSTKLPGLVFDVQP